MDPLTLMTVATVGTNVATGIYDFFNRPQLQTPDWGQAAALYSKFIREETAETAEDAYARTRLEAERVGLNSGAAYMEMVGAIQEQRSRILNREISRFSIQQELQKSQWGQKASLAEYQQDIGLKERTMQRLENIGGAIAGQAQEGYSSELRKQYSAQFENMYGGLQKQIEEQILSIKQANQEIQAFQDYFGEVLGMDFKTWKEERMASQLGAIDTYNNNTPAPMSGR